MSSLAIVIPAYNEERHLKACLDAIAAQIKAPDEVIVVDNNSTDQTAAIAKSYPFVRVIREPRQGIVFARNRGFNAVKSDLIGRIDADTILPPDWVERVKEFYADPAYRDQALTGGGYFYNIRAPRFVAWSQNQVAFRMNRLLLGHYIVWGSNMVLPRRVWRAVRSSVCLDQDIHEDLDLAIHLHRQGYEIAYRAGIEVGVKMRRVRSDLSALWGNLMWWPRTLRIHGLKTWIFGWLGAIFMLAWVPVAYVAEWLARLFGRGKLTD